ncbi:hypothetical protein BC829DRAFT_194629 [Chytridium lagenaria]|nr:hypothetical protein BC829DRAFT_194629 [Chytridium lagenaria]
MILLRFNCPDASCDVACPEGWPELRRHVQATHGKYLCDLCTRHQRLFTHEHALYTATELDRHFKVGDETDKSFKGHPSCGFCKTHFYGDDELYEHCRKEHEQCFLCTRAGVRHQYYVNYNALEMHFRGDHFACLEPECLEKKFQVFISDIDLKAHDMEVHPHKRTSRGKGEKIEVNFQVTGGPSNGRRRNADRLPAQSPAPTPSDANGRAVDDRARREPDPSLFRGSNGREARAAALREEEFPPPAPIPGASTSKAPIAPTPMRQTQSPKIKNRRPNVMNVEEFPTPQAAARESKTSKPASTQDGDVVSKLQILFESNEETFTEFKQFATSFRQGVIDANEFFVKFLSLALEGAATELDKKNTELTVFNIWTRMADTVPDEGQDASARWNPNTRTKGKREQMLEALNNFRAKVKRKIP